MQCWACGQPARGFGHLDLRHPPADPRRYPHRWAFCSRRCQDAFHSLYDTRRRHAPASIEALIPMTLPLSPDAQRACLRALGTTAEQIGFDLPLAQYTQAQAQHLIDAVIHAYERHLQSDARAMQGLPPLDDFEDDDIPFDHRRDAAKADANRRITPVFTALDFNATSRTSRRPTAPRGVDARARKHRDWSSP